MIRIQSHWIVPILCTFCAGIIASGFDDLRTLNELRNAVLNGQSTQAQSSGASDQLKLGPIQPDAPTMCPDPSALDLFKHEIAYQNTEENQPLKGLQEIHVDVWERGFLAAFYVREKLNDAIPTIRMVYPIANHQIEGGYTCPAEENWKECVEKNAGTEALNYLSRTCSTTVDLRAIPAWEPSPDDQTKRRIAAELRDEIQAKWPSVQQIVIRNFNLKDNQITMYLKMPDGDYYEGCGFSAISEPHCEGWHLFGNAPNAGIRKWIFERPYRLK